MRGHPTFRDLHDASADGADQATLLHVRSCTACAARAARIGSVRGALNAATAVTPPADAFAGIAARLAAGDAVILPAPDQRTSRGLASWRRVVAAAAIILCLAGATAALIVTGVVDRLLPGADGRENMVPVTEAPRTPPAVPPAQFVLPGDADLDVRLERSGPGLVVRVRIGTGSDTGVRATGGAASARFRSASGRLTIEGAEAGEILIVLPLSPHRVRVLVNGAVWLENDGGSLRITAPAADTAGSDFILAVPSLLNMQDNAGKVSR